VFDKMAARRYFEITKRRLLRWDVNDFKQHQGCFPWASLISFKIPQNGAPNAL
jgi:hypothetical protein